MAKNSENIKKLISYKKKAILSKEIYASDGFNVTLFCLANGSNISKHSSSKEGLVSVVEGFGIFVLEGKRILMKPGVIISMKKGAIHSLAAKTNLSFVLILINK